MALLPSSTSPAELVHTDDATLPTLRLFFTPQHPVINAFSAKFSTAPAPPTSPVMCELPVRTLIDHAVSSLYASRIADIGHTQPWRSADMTSFPSTPAPPATKDMVAGQPLDEEAAHSRPCRVNWGALLQGDGANPPPFDERATMTHADKARWTLVNALTSQGLAFVTGLPTDKTGDNPDAHDPTSPSLARLADMVRRERGCLGEQVRRLTWPFALQLGEIRHTFYGPLWNVRSLGASSRNIAYTNLDLGLHMDLCYMENPPRFQFLHMLRNRVSGGQSIFVDAYAVAEHMWAHDRAAWRLLSEVPVCFQYRNDNRFYRRAHPTFEVAPRSAGGASAPSETHMPRLTAVNYSPPFQGPLPLHITHAHDPQRASSVLTLSPQQRIHFYQALRVFADRTMEARFCYERTMQEGECVLFDNRRILHARRGFEWHPSEESAGTDGVTRWLKGMWEGKRLLAKALRRSFAFLCSFRLLRRWRCDLELAQDAYGQSKDPLNSRASLAHRTLLFPTVYDGSTNTPTLSPCLIVDTVPIACATLPLVARPLSLS